LRRCSKAAKCFSRLAKKARAGSFRGSTKISGPGGSKIMNWLGRTSVGIYLINKGDKLGVGGRESKKKKNTKKKQIIFSKFISGSTSIPGGNQISRNLLCGHRVSDCRPLNGGGPTGPKTKGAKPIPGGWAICLATKSGPRGSSLSRQKLSRVWNSGVFSGFHVHHFAEEKKNSPFIGWTKGASGQNSAEGPDLEGIDGGGLVFQISRGKKKKKAG